MNAADQTTSTPEGPQDPTGEQAVTREETPERATAPAPAEEAPEQAPSEGAPAQEAPAQAPAAPAPRPTPGAMPTPGALAGRRPAPPVTPVADGSAESDQRPAGSPERAGRKQRTTPQHATFVPTPVPGPLVDTSELSGDMARFGSLDESGQVVRTDADGTTTVVGSYPDAAPEQAVGYFVRKFEEVAASATLLAQRIHAGSVMAAEGRQSLEAIRQQVEETPMVGDYAALHRVLEELTEALREKERIDQQQRAEARAEAAAEREKLVVEAETIAATAPEQMQWKQASARMRGMVEEWKAMQRAQIRLDKPTESELWQRLAAARNTFDKVRKAHFAQLDAEREEARRRKEELVVQAERLSTSTDFDATPGAFKRLMQDWKRAGRAPRTVDDQLWERFRAAQDAFFDAKDARAAAEDEELAANLPAKEALLVEAEALLPVKDLEATKKRLRAIQDRFEAAGRVPRKDVKRIEGRMRAVEQAVRDAEDAQWTQTKPEQARRASAFATQLEGAVQELEAKLAKAETSGDEKRAAKVRQELETKRQWLEQAQSGLEEFGGGR
ncbi:protein of unknown function [Kytococcus aerolatus]|uniref:DUF349 domain-containing protein n=1 Tax=Kytococcus aerolatus TaxID=592308 RepID=A0A212T2L4_9MICO|nr:DUF349 domain-containing protein [Kytococcus aerolatus]SNC60283.1 protein of unknown function [Kytococcus aerolatus]